MTPKTYTEGALKGEQQESKRERGQVGKQTKRHTPKPIDV